MTTAPARRQVEVRIGARLRGARRNRGLTLDRLAEMTTLTKGFLSRLERDEVSPSVASLVAVCEALGIRIGELFETPATSLVRAGEGRPINFGGSAVREELLTPGTQQQLRVIHSVIEPAGTGGEELYSLKAEVEFAYVLDGALEVVLSTDTVRLERGDALTFPGSEPHTWRNASAHQAAEVLWVLAPAP